MEIEYFDGNRIIISMEIQCILHEIDLETIFEATRFFHQVRSAATSAFGEIMQLASPSKLSIETLGSFRDESR